MKKKIKKNEKKKNIVQFCRKDLVVEWLAQPFNLKIIKCTITVNHRLNAALD